MENPRVVPGGVSQIFSLTSKASLAWTGIGVIRTVTADKAHVISKGFKFHVRSEPAMSKSKKTGKVFR